MSPILTIPQNKLETLLGFPSRVVASSDSSRPEALYLEIECEGNNLRATGTNTEVEISSLVTLDSAPSEGGFRFTAPAKKTLEVLKYLPQDSMVELHFSENYLVLSCLKNKYKLALLEAPIMTGSSEQVEDRATDRKIIFFPEFNPIRKHRLSCTELGAMLRQTTFSMGRDNARQYLNSVLLELSTGFVRVVATDGHRLSQSTLNGEFGVALDVEPDIKADSDLTQIIVPRKAVLELQRLLESGAKGDATILCGSNLFQVDINGEIKVTTRLLDGQYPAYKGVFPKETDKTLKCDREHLLRACMRASSISGEVALHFHLSEAVDLNITSEEGIESAAEVFFEGEYSGPKLDIAFRGRYITAVLSALEGDAVEMCAKESESSVLFKDPNNADVAYVVMPIRV